MPRRRPPPSHVAVPTRDTPLLAWEKQSHWRYSASIGPLRIEVVKRAYGRTASRVWTVGTVFGVEYHDWRNQGPGGNGHVSFVAAQCAAEALAALMLQHAQAFVAVREEAGGPPRHGRPKR